jgi:hypothetical protein
LAKAEMRVTELLDSLIYRHEQRLKNDTARLNASQWSTIVYSKRNWIVVDSRLCKNNWSCTSIIIFEQFFIG